MGHKELVLGFTLLVLFGCVSSASTNVPASKSCYFEDMFMVLYTLLRELKFVYIYIYIYMICFWFLELVIILCWLHFQRSLLGLCLMRCLWPWNHYGHSKQTQRQVCRSLVLPSFSFFLFYFSKIYFKLLTFFFFPRFILNC